MCCYSYMYAIYSKCLTQITQGPWIHDANPAELLEIEQFVARLHKDLANV